MKNMSAVNFERFPFRPDCSYQLVASRHIKGIRLSIVLSSFVDY